LDTAQQSTGKRVWDASQWEQFLFKLSINTHHVMPEGRQLPIETRNVYLE
jgi:hypothetical protein